MVDNGNSQTQPGEYEMMMCPHARLQCMGMYEAHTCELQKENGPSILIQHSRGHSKARTFYFRKMVSEIRFISIGNFVFAKW